MAAHSRGGQQRRGGGKSRGGSVVGVAGERGEQEMPAAAAEVPKNWAPKFAASLLKSSQSLDGKLAADFELLRGGEAMYLREWGCGKNDLSLLQELSTELVQAVGGKEKDGEKTGLVQWSKHMKWEQPDFSLLFQRLVGRMAAHFDVEVFASRLNLYADATAWKPFHHDSHAYHSGHGAREDFTMGLSLGAERALVFMHPPSSAHFSFPQANGDVFAFN